MDFIKGKIWDNSHKTKILFFFLTLYCEILILSLTNNHRLNAHIAKQSMSVKWKGWHNLLSVKFNSDRLNNRLFILGVQCLKSP